MALEGVATDADTESLRSHDSTGVPPMAELSPTRQYNVLPVSHADPSSPGGCYVCHAPGVPHCHF